MSQMNGDRRVLVLAVMGMLFFRLLAWGANGERVAHAYLNQTIPTPTPSAVPVTPTTAEPTLPVFTPRATEPPPAAPDTPAPPVPSWTSQPEGGTPVPPTTTATASPPPAGSTPTPLPAGTLEPTVPPVGPSRALTPGEPPLPSPSTAAPGTSAEAEIAPTGSPTPTRTWLSTAAMAAESRGEGSPLSLSCLWPVAGLILITTGAAVLLGRRRSK